MTAILRSPVLASKRLVATVMTGLLSLALILAAGFVLRPRCFDLTHAYAYLATQMLRDVASVTKTNAESDDKWKESSPSEFKKRLMSIDPNVRLRAIKAIAEKSDPQFIPQMVKLLNDTTPVQITVSSDASQISEVARSALVKLLRDNVVREPGNIALYVPLFEAGRNGSLREKLGVIDILSALREPIAYPLLKYLRENKQDPEVQVKATEAMRFLTPNSVTAPDYFLVTSRRVEFMCLLMISALTMGVAAIAWLLTGKGVKLFALGLLAVFLNFGLGLLVYVELNRGILTQNSLQDALKTGDLMALRTMNYTDYTFYPGDSFFCQKLAKLGNIETFRALIALPYIEPDDSLYLKTNFDVRSRWIMARIIVLNLGKPSLDAIIDGRNPDINYALAETFDQLKIQDKQIAGYLEKLSQSEPERIRKTALFSTLDARGGFKKSESEPERVRKTAEKALSLMKNRPVWPSM